MSQSRTEEPPTEPNWEDPIVDDRLLAAAFGCEQEMVACSGAEYARLVRTSPTHGTRGLKPRRRVEYERSDGSKIRILTSVERTELLRDGREFLQLDLEFTWTAANDVTVVASGVRMSSAVVEGWKRGSGTSGCTSHRYRIQRRSGAWSCAGVEPASAHSIHPLPPPYLIGSEPVMIDAGIISGAQLMAILQEQPEAFLETHRATPLRKGEQIVGWVLGSFLPSVLTERLREGDVILRINGNPLDGPAAWQDAWDSMYSATGLTIELRRLFGEITIHYRITPQWKRVRPRARAELKGRDNHARSHRSAVAYCVRAFGARGA